MDGGRPSVSSLRGIVAAAHPQAAQAGAALLRAGGNAFDAGVAALGGTAFGPYGEGFLRFSYANSVENIKAALEAIRAQLS